MARACQKNHVLVVSLDDAVEVSINKCQARARPPMSKQAALDMLGLERLLEQRIIPQIDHAQSQILASPPVGIRFSQLFGVQRRPLDGRSRRAVRAQQVDR